MVPAQIISREDCLVASILENRFHTTATTTLWRLLLHEASLDDREC